MTRRRHVFITGTAVTWLVAARGAPATVEAPLQCVRGADVVYLGVLDDKGARLEVARVR